MDDDGQPAQVLLVEDDEAVRTAVKRGLQLGGFEVGAVATAEEALTGVTARPPAVIVLDVGLPAMSGIELCARLRAMELAVPVLMLSARDQVADRVAGLQAGADDYLIKPFDLEELTLRVRALLRRAGPVADQADPSVIACGLLRLDPDRRTADWDGEPLQLSRREFDLLLALATNADLVLTRIRLLELVWGYDFDTDTNVVDVFVGYLRKKLQAAGAPRIIHTVRGVGFVLRPA